ncbi:AAA family ATPase (plasmid) [Ruegeria sp. SCSIO 43209]|uniref:AAA family ATPase n=1 Tax=Ruegeria sp. SCSIO 43209 TaxID=2793010 RepID=UPI001CA9BC29|nr:AAA family ATPase [Ruegeria sp. SCSIO 43209]UAB91538.1 AAA family ATPase [Ruegeria sp. SCSIO 43209]
MQEQYNTDALEASAFPISYTIVENAQGALTKTYEADETGTPRAAHRGALSRGIARLESSSGSVNDHLEQFENVLIDLKASEAIVTGVPILDGLEWRLGTKADVENGEAEISRSSNCFVALPAPSLMCLDLDTKTYPDAIHQRISEVGGVKAVLQSVFTGFQGAGCLSRPSASTGIENPLTGHETGSAGEHLYFVAADGSDVSDFAQRLHDRLVLSGWGWGEVSKSGRVMTRTLIDRSATSPFRVVYEADAILRDMLEYKQPRRATVSDGGLLDTSALTGLNDAETAALKETEAAIKDSKKAEAAAVRQEWKEERLRLSARERPDSARAANEMERAVESDELSGEFEIQFDDGTCATVSEILANRKAFHKRTCADPMEPDYGGGNNIAILYTDHPARVWSQAHGGVDYRLVRTEHDFFEPLPIEQLTSDEAIQEMFSEGASSQRVNHRKFPDLKGVRTIRDIGPIPRRQHLIKPRLPLADVVQCIGEPGVSKSAFALRDALLVASGCPEKLGIDPIEEVHISGPALIYNAEDSRDEMDRRLTSIMRHHRIEETQHDIILWSGLDHGSLKLLHRPRDRGPLVPSPDVDELKQIIREHNVKLVYLDPQVGLASGAHENHSEDMDAVFQTLAEIASDCKITIVVIHHTAKHTRDAKGDMGAGRGSFAAVAKVRSAFTLVNVTGTGDEKDWGVTEEDQLIRLDYAKVSHSRKPTKPQVFKRASILVGNGEGYAEGDALPIDEFMKLPHQERHRIEGDYAPVLEAVDLSKLKAAAAIKRSNEDDAIQVRVREIALEALQGSDVVTVSQVAGYLGERFLSDGITQSASRRAVDPKLRIAIAGGVRTVRDGLNGVLQLEEQKTRRGGKPSLCLTWTPDVLSADEGGAHG